MFVKSWLKTMSERAFGGLYHRAQFQDQSVHKVELVKELQELIPLFLSRAGDLFPDLSERERKALYNRLFQSSRVLQRLALERMKKGEEPEAENADLPLDGSAVFRDLLAQTVKLGLYLALAIGGKNQPLPTRKILASGIDASAEKVLGPLLQGLPADAVGWAIYTGLQFPRQKAFLEGLQTEDRAAGLSVPVFQPADILRVSRRFGKALLHLLRRGRFDRQSAYLLFSISLLLLETAGESRRVRRLLDSGLKAMVSLDEMDYLAHFRNSLLQEAGVAVVGAMHGFGVFGPHHAYSRYCLWGEDMRAFYSRTMDPENLVVTGSPGFFERIRKEERRKKDALSVFMQYVSPRNDWAYMRDQIRGAAEAIERSGKPLTLILKLHPRQTPKDRDRIRELVETLDVSVECLEDPSRNAEVLGRSLVAVTNYSTMGFESIAAGIPTLFFSRAREALVPMAGLVPSSRVREYDAYVTELAALLKDASKRRRLVKKEQTALTRIIARDTEAALQEVRSLLAEALESGEKDSKSP